MLLLDRAITLGEQLLVVNCLLRIEEAKQRLAQRDL